MSMCVSETIMSSPCHSCLAACRGACTDPVTLCRGWFSPGCLLVTPERKALCVCQEGGGTELCRVGKGTEWKQVVLIQASSIMLHGRNSDTGCKVTLYSSLWAPEPLPGTWYCCSTSSRWAQGIGQNFFLLNWFV